MMGDIGDSAGTQTQDLQNRNLTLYSAKLRGPFSFILYKRLQRYKIILRNQNE